MMKLKVQFGPETRFDQPIRRTTRTRAQWSPGIQVLSRAVDHGRTAEADQARIDQWIFPEDV